MTRRVIALGGAMLIAVTLLGTVPAMARGTDVIKSGACDSATSWKLKIKAEDPAAIQAEVEIDENVVGHTWRVRLLQNGEVVAAGQRVTLAPSGSFNFNRLLTDAPGRDVIRFRAVNLATGEICKGGASLSG